MWCKILLSRSAETTASRREPSIRRTWCISSASGASPCWGAAGTFWHKRLLGFLAVGGYCCCSASLREDLTEPTRKIDFTRRERYPEHALSSRGEFEFERFWVRKSDQISIWRDLCWIFWDWIDFFVTCAMNFV